MTWVGLGGVTVAVGQTLTGQATALSASLSPTLGAALPAITVFANAGPLEGPHDARHASLLEGNLAPLLSGTTLHAVTIGGLDRATSEASLANLALSVGSLTVTLRFARAVAEGASGSGASGFARVDELFVNGLPIIVTGAVNQLVPIPAGHLIVNEQKMTARSAHVNALHIVVEGVADIVVASALAGF